jgi:hypothetical protein
MTDMTVQSYKSLVSSLTRLFGNLLQHAWKHCLLALHGLQDFFIMNNTTFAVIYLLEIAASFNQHFFDSNAVLEYEGKTFIFYDTIQVFWKFVYLQLRRREKRRFKDLIKEKLNNDEGEKDELGGEVNAILS